MSGAMRPALACRISGTATVFPGRLHTTEEVAARCGRDADDARRRTGIDTRWLVEPGDAFNPHGARALTGALDDAGLRPSDLARVVYATSCSYDRLAPANANEVAKLAGVPPGVPCFDLNNGCMAFPTALDLVARTIATGEGPTAIVTLDFPSRYARPEEHRPFLVLGDGVTAAIVEPTGGNGGVVASYFANDGYAFDGTGLENSTGKDEHAWISFGAPHRDMQQMALDALRKGVDTVLARAGRTLDDMAWVLPHQPNGSMFDAIVAELGIRPERTLNVVREIGSAGAVAIPHSLDRLRRTGRLAPGDEVLLVGVGVGVSYGAVLYREPA